MEDLISRVPAQDIARYADWTECAAFRIVKLEDGTYTMEVTNDLELITQPGAI